MKQKILRFGWLIIAVMVLAFAPKTVQAQPTVTLETPDLVNGYYQIANAGNLYWFAKEVNSGNTSICAVLTQDITVNTGGILKEDGSLISTNPTEELIQWTPIGNKSHGYPYSGTFDGQGNTISGLYYDGKEQEVGLFGCLGVGSIIRNVGVKASYFNGVRYGSRFGGVCGLNEGGTISNCYNEKTTVGATGDAFLFVYVGGVCGLNEGGTISNCYNAGNASGENRAYIGGVCGYNINGPIKNCYNVGNVSGKSSSGFFGGVCGCNIDATIKNCYNMGEIGYDESNTYVGGVCGYKISGTITNCYYLKDENNSQYFGIGKTSSDEKGITEGKGADEFTNGSVAWLLNGSEDDTQDNTSPWLQNLSDSDGDKYPVLKATTSNNVCPIVVKDGDDSYKNGVHSYDNVTFADFPDTGTANLYSQVCDHCKGAAQEDKKKIKELNCKDNDITITKEDNVWKTEAKITLGDDPTTNWYNAPVEFTTTGGVSYTRTMSDKNRWATVCLPYAVNTENENCSFYGLSGVETDKITLTEITDATTIAAGTPVFVKANDGVENITFSATGETKMLTAPTAGDPIDGYTLTGVFNLTELSKVEENVGGDLFIKNDNMWNMSQPTNNMKVKIFHAYLKNNGSGTYAPKRSIAVDGEATAISDALDTLNDANAEYYDMSGRRISSLQKGVNIIKSGNKTRKVVVQ